MSDAARRRRVAGDAAYARLRRRRRARGVTFIRTAMRSSAVLRVACAAVPRRVVRSVGNVQREASAAVLTSLFAAVYTPRSGA